MRTVRLLAGVVAASAMATSVVVAAPAHARDTWTTTTVAEPSETTVEFGDTIDITVDVDSQTGLPPTGGTSTLLALRAGATEWAQVATTTSPGASFLDVRPRMNTTYKVVYAGHVEADRTKGDTYTSSESATFGVDVSRRITHPSAGFVLKGKVTPDYRKKKIVIEVSKKQDEGYKKFMTIRTDRAGAYKVTLPRRSGTWYYTVIVKGDARYLGTGFAWRTWVS
ncbi:hypothetical protein [Nocardioides renjunii]|uniref:hypothetical protein n=1 Tax=Nocardioides renjunii TaxID=3095075 RepID=UPI002AFF1EA2|nr:hypothetical protein [Nocardioides sp. S-34]WQQ21530.1 hypothetical protein SHK17_16745 [Nocardioides sp. S-34]